MYGSRSIFLTEEDEDFVSRIPPSVQEESPALPTWQRAPQHLERICRLKV